MTSPVKIIGICGHPLHGKSTAQRFLSRAGVTALDDSEPLRRLAMEEYGLSWNQVSTQEGKQEVIWVDGRAVTVRQALGDLGKVYEKKHGPNYWIERAITDVTIAKCMGAAQETQPGRSPISFGSVRMGQAHPIRAAGGVVIAINNPDRPLSKHDFDQFDPQGVDVWVRNDGDLWDLNCRVVAAVADYIGLDYGAHMNWRRSNGPFADWSAL